MKFYEEGGGVGGWVESFHLFRGGLSLPPVF